MFFKFHFPKVRVSYRHMEEGSKLELRPRLDCL